MDIALQVLVATSSTICVCLEAAFLLGISRRPRSVCLFLIYVLLLYGCILAVNRLSHLLQLPLLLYPLVGYASAFLPRLLFARLVLDRGRGESCAAAMILISVKIIVDALHPFTLFSFGHLVHWLSGSRPPVMPVLLFAAACQVFCCALLLILIYRYFWPDMSDSVSGQLYVILIPCALLVFALETSMNVQIVEAGRWGVTAAASASDGYSLRTLLAVVLSVAVLFVTLASFRRLCESVSRERSAAALACAVGVQRRYVAEARERYDSYRAFRHDLQNHLLILSGLLSSGEPAEAQAYLRHMGEIAGAIAFPVDSGNATVDALLSQKLHAARSRGIAVSANLALQSVSGVSDFDLCVVLANVLDNAVEACAGEEAEGRFVELLAAARGSFLVVRVRNGCPQGRVLVEGQGLRNVRAVAEQYAGTLEVDVSDGVATTAVLLCLEG